uniref:Uncharacterized protein n=1 Tax=Aster yellows phytoplasma TaxID=35779 RepID=Q847T9_ASTYP|nr:hypothetical protein [Aster yellows phytoplasma]
MNGRVQLAMEGRKLKENAGSLQCLKLLLYSVARLRIFHHKLFSRIKYFNLLWPDVDTVFV